MTQIVSIQEKIKKILNSSVSAEVYLVFKDSKKGLQFKFSNCENQITEPEIRQSLIKSLEDLISNEDFSIKSLSSSDEFPGALYHYDYDEKPDDLNKIIDFIKSTSQINFELSTKELFNSKKDRLNQLFAFLFVLGTDECKISLFKKHYPFCTIKSDKGLFNIYDDLLTKYEGNDILRIPEGFDLIIDNDEVYVLNIKMLEHNLGFKQLILQQANKAIDWLQSRDLVDEPQSIRDNTEDITFSRKLVKMFKSSPVISLNISNESLIKFTKNEKELKKLFKYDTDGKRFIVNTKTLRKNLLMLLNDEFLHSKLTHLNYSSASKEPITTTNIKAPDNN